jgi:nucleotide-binding universal stress UspA family protein
MKPYSHILVGIDFSPGCIAAVRAAARLAGHHGTPVTALHVIDAKLAGAMKEAHHTTDEDVYKHVDESVRALLAKAEVDERAVKVELRIGHPYLVLMDACQRHQSGLLVLGTRGTEHGPNEIGAIAAKCVRKAPADVLLVREGKVGPFQHITACVDLSETSAKAVRAARLVAEKDKADLDCLFIYQSAIAMSLDYGGFVPPLPVDSGESAEGWRKDLDAFVQPLLRSAEGLQWRSLVLERINVREAIYDHVRESRTDLVVLGTRGKTDLRTLIMGTTAEKIVSHAPCSILAVKPDDFAPPISEPLLPPATVPMA